MARQATKACTTYLSLQQLQNLRASWNTACPAWYRQAPSALSATEYLYKRRMLCDVMTMREPQHQC